MSLRVLAIGMVDSIHFARWLDGLSDLDVSIFVFPSGPHRKLHANIVSILQREDGKVRIPFGMALLSLPIWLLDKLLGDRLRGLLLRFYLQKNKFDVIHFHEMQSGGYPLRFVPQRILDKSTVFYTPYGSDLFWFGEIPRHRVRIRKTLRIVNYIFPECDRDASLALAAGFKGDFGPRMAAGGPLQFPPMDQSKIAKRNKIAVKGYGGRWGRATTALRSLEQVQDALQGFEIHVISVTRDVQREILRLQKTSTLKIVSHPKFSLSSFEVRQLLLESKYYVALSASDGFPASLTEAALCGAIPIQSSTACLPASLVEINPSGFLSEKSWAQVGEAIVAWELDPQRTKLLSLQFSNWATDQQLSRVDFMGIMTEAYGL